MSCRTKGGVINTVKPILVKVKADEPIPPT